MKLSQISELFLGILKTRSKSNVITGYKYRIIESCDFSSININKPINELEIFYSTVKIDDKVILKEGDIILKMFPPFSIALITNQYIGCIVPSNIVIIRSNKLMPEFLYYSLFYEMGNLANKILQGTTIRMIHLNSLKEVEINTNQSLEVIQWKSKIIKLYNHQSKLLERKKELLNKVMKFYFKGELNVK